MKSFATDAIPTSWLLPLDSIWLVTRSRTAIEMVAPSAAAASVACAIRAGNPSNAAVGGDSGCVDRRVPGLRASRTPLRSRSSTPSASPRWRSAASAAALAWSFHGHVYHSPTSRQG